MAVQHIFISIKESTLIINSTLFSIVAVDNHQLAQLGNACCRKVHFCIGKNSFPTFTLLSGMFPSHSSYRYITYFWWIPFYFNCRRYPIIFNYTILPNNIIILKRRITNFKLNLKKITSKRSKPWNYDRKVTLKLQKWPKT